MAAEVRAGVDPLARNPDPDAPATQEPAAARDVVGLVGVQLGRRFRALKAWVIFRSFGRKGMATRLRECVRLANVLADWIKSDNRFELAAPVSMGVVCFRFVGGDESKIDQLNGEIVEKINASGRAYLTQTKLRDRTVMRIGLGNVLTTEEHLQRVWEMIGETANELNREK